MRREGGCIPVCLEDVHLRAAGPVLTHRTVRLHLPRGALALDHAPVDGVALAVEELHATRALRVAVAGAVLGAGAVVTNAFTAVLLHLDEVQGGIDSAGDGGDVDVHREFLVLQLEDLVCLVTVRQVDSRGNSTAWCNVLEFHAAQNALDRRNTVVVRILPHVCTLDHAVLRADGRIRAELGHPGIALQAVFVAPHAVGPPPGLVHRDAGLLLGAAGLFRAVLNGHRRMDFSL
mmetsp:Transcript_82800/g.257208  ORF Transcript_82800/g.257208 Transcript_82800/m.257208 type:complete len:233 (+) Transcript_82800:1010-1708(+)